MNKKDETDIDYLHPNGKPETREEPEPKAKKFDEREVEQAAKSERNALIDADGHHICSAECQSSIK
jgi:hypothetical protein